MSVMSAEQRRQLRDAVDRSRREYLEVDRGRLQARTVAPAERPPVITQVVVPVRRASKATTETMVAKQQPTHCMFCGTPACGGVCVAHSDLAAVS